MLLFNFLSCCFSTNTIIEDPPKTSYELLFDNETPRFNSFSKAGSKNSNIDTYYYKREEYNDILKDVNNTQESLWKSRILSYTIRNRQVFMHYDPYKMGFTYYSSESLPYHLLNIVAMKYVRIFHCYDFFMDNQMTYFIDNTIENEDKTEEDTEKELKITQENGDPNSLYRVHYIDIDKKNKPLTAGPFAKLKRNNANVKTNETNNGTNEDKHNKLPTIPRYKNKFIHGGSLYNFDFLKKKKMVNSFRSPVIDNMKEFSYKDYKALQS